MSYHLTSRYHFNDMTSFNIITLLTMPECLSQSMIGSINQTKNYNFKHKIQQFSTHLEGSSLVETKMGSQREHTHNAGCH